MGWELSQDAGGSLLDEIVRDGARRMLAAALQAEVAAYIEAFAGEVDENGHRLVVRNGFHEPREVTNAAGAIPVKVGSRRGWPRCCRCCTCTACPAATSGPRSLSSSAPAAACRRPRG